MKKSFYVDTVTDRATGETYDVNYTFNEFNSEVPGVGPGLGGLDED